MDKTTRTSAAAADKRLTLLTVEAVANMLSLSRTSVYRLMETGELKYLKLGAARRVRLSDVEEMVERAARWEGQMR